MSEWIRAISGCSSVPGISHRMVYCTPQLAKVLLALNSHNRKLSSQVVSKYVSEIASGEWMPVASGIGIDDKGVLCDGQHRLAAIADGSKTVPLLIVWGLPSSSQEKVDRHTRRGLYQAFALSGMSVHRRCVQIATYLSRRVLNGGVAPTMSTPWASPSDSDVKAVLENHAESIEVVTNMMSSTIKGITSAGVMSALVIGHELLPDKTIEFIRKILDPSELTADDPRFRFWRWATVTSQHTGGGLARQVKDYRSTAYCLNAYFAGKQIVSVREADDVELPK